MDKTDSGTRPRVEGFVSTNILTLGMRLLFSSHWNKEMR